MKKLTMALFVFFLVEAAGNVMGGIYNTATFQTQDGPAQKISWDEHLASLQEGSDPAGFALSG